MKLEVRVSLTPRQVAEAFCEMDDEKQAQFFIEAAAIAATWTGSDFPQWLFVGRHLRDCDCSNDDARALVQDIADGMKQPTPKEP